jgi:hypothetical protein
MPCRMRRESVALDTAAALSLMPPSAPAKMLIELFAVVADESANQPTAADDVACGSSSAPSTV